MSPDFDKALEFIKKHHAGQFRSNNFPVWHHLARVSKRLEFIVRKNKEGTDGEINELTVAALGHDLLEDTKATLEEIEIVFGAKGREFIEGMTNSWGDKDVAPYVKKVSRASEEVRLIKLSDLFDNMTDTTYNLAVLGKEWVTSYLLPIITPMKEAMLKTTFDKYKKTGDDLKFMVSSAFSLLNEELNKI